MERFIFEEEKEFDVILLGRVAIDFNPLDYYKPLKDCQQFQKYLGGSPANIAVGLQRLGKKIGFIAKVSDDSFGDFVIDYFNQEGIDTTHISRCKNGEKLGLTFTEMLSETQSSILMYRKDAADLKLTTEDIDEDYIKKAKAILISGTALSESPSREAALKAMALAKKNKVTVIFDIDYREYTWKNQDEITVYYSLAARDSDIILGSREEFDLTERFLFSDYNDKQTAGYYHSLGAKIVIIKHGKEGSRAYVKGDKNYIVKPFPVKLLKSFGGGDGYASAFLFGLLEGMDIRTSLLMGSASAAMLVASHGCSKDMPSREALTEFIKKSEINPTDLVVTSE